MLSRFPRFPRSKSKTSWKRTSIKAQKFLDNLKQRTQIQTRALTPCRMGDGLRLNIIVLSKASSFMVKIGVWLKSTSARELVVKLEVTLKSITFGLKRSKRKEKRELRAPNFILNTEKVTYQWLVIAQICSQKLNRQSLSNRQTQNLPYSLFNLSPKKQLNFSQKTSRLSYQTTEARKT